MTPEPTETGSTRGAQAVSEMPSPERAAAHASQERALVALKGIYDGTAPEISETLLGHAGIIMGRAIQDCLALDFRIVDSGGSAEYVKGCSSFDSPPVLTSIRMLALRRDNLFMSAKKHMGISILNDDHATARSSVALHEIRERLRDGLTMEQAIQTEAFWIHTMATEGNVPFFKRLAGVIAKPRLRRPLEDWIYRAWLPLRLWECPKKAHNAYSRITRAGKLLQLPEIESPKWELPLFLKGWNNVLNKTMRDLK